MNPHFFAAPFYFAFIWFKVRSPFLLCFHLVQGSRFKVQGSRFKVRVAASPPFLEDGILVSQPSPLGNAIKLRKSLAAQRLASHFGGSAEGNMCKRTGFSRRFTPKNPVRLHNPFGELPRWGAKNVLPLNLIAFPSRGRCPAGADRADMV